MLRPEFEQTLRRFERFLKQGRLSPEDYDLWTGKTLHTLFTEQVDLANLETLDDREDAEEMLAYAEPGDELWRWQTPYVPLAWSGGLALVRDGEVVDIVRTSVA
jgi:hypothetical protein